MPDDLSRIDPRPKVAEALRRVRAGMGLSQASLARRYGISQATLSRWEAGSITPRGPHLVRIASDARMKLSELLADAPDAVRVPVLHGIGGPVLDRTELVLPPRLAAAASLVGVEVTDLSADLLYRPGTILVCRGAARQPVAHGAVLVLRQGTERRLARAFRRGDALFWMSLSRQPEFAAPLGPGWKPEMVPVTAVAPLG